MKINLRKKIEVKVNNCHKNAYLALTDLGYTDTVEDVEHIDGKYYRKYTKDGKAYVYREFTYNNGYVYSVTLSPMEN